MTYREGISCGKCIFFHDWQYTDPKIVGDEIEEDELGEHITGPDVRYTKRICRKCGTEEQIEPKNSRFL